MRRNRMRKNAHGLFSGRRGKAGCLALCLLCMAAASCMLIQPERITGSELQRPFVSEQVKLNDSYKVEADGFVMMFYVGKDGDTTIDLNGYTIQLCS